MDLLKQIGKQSKLIMMMNSILIIIFFQIGCTFWDGCSAFEQGLKDICKEKNIFYSVALSEVTDFEWDSLYVISGPRFPDEVEEIINCKYGDMVQDDCRQYIFLKNGLIVNEFSSQCRSFSFIGLMDGKGYAQFGNSSKIKVKKWNDEDVFYYQVHADK